MSLPPLLILPSARQRFHSHFARRPACDAGPSDQRIIDQLLVSLSFQRFVRATGVSAQYLAGAAPVHRGESAP